MRDAAQNGGTFRELWLCAAAVQSVLGNPTHVKQLQTVPATDFVAYAKASESRDQPHLPSVLLALVEALHLMASAVWTELIQDNVSGGADAARLLVFALDILPRVADLAATSIRKGDDEGVYYARDCLVIATTVLLSVSLTPAVFRYWFPDCSNNCSCLFNFVTLMQGVAHGITTQQCVMFFEVHFTH